MAFPNFRYVFQHFRRQPDVLEDLTRTSSFYHAAASPLSSLLLNLELARSHRSRPTQPYLDQALLSARHLKQLLGSVQQSAVVQPFLVKPVLRETVLLFTGLRPETNCQTNLDIPSRLTLRGSQFHLQEALRCALTNAAESYPATAHHRFIYLLATYEKAQLKLVIVDGGQGLPRWPLPLRLADGHSTKHPGRGWGLGWIKRVVMTHFHGKLQFISKPGRGTTQIWQLPAQLNT